MWYERTKAAREAGDLVVIGLIQEQHPARCRLFMEWKQIDWPIYVDALNRTGVWAVPLVWAIDEHGVLRSTRPRPDWVTGEFLEKDWPEPTDTARAIACSDVEARFLKGEFEETVRMAKASLANEASERPKAQTAALHFLLGCAYRARHDSKLRRPGDFQNAVLSWTRASQLAPRNYIYRRRIQQYGPRLEKPYPFYDWIPDARAALKRRGVDVPTLVAEPEGSEFAMPLRNFPDRAAEQAEPDPKDEIDRDEVGLLSFESVVAPSPVHAGSSFRVYLRWTPSAELRAYFDDEAGPPVVWIDPSDGIATPKQRYDYVPTKGDVASKGRRTRSVEIEFRLDAELEPGRHALRGYVLANVCEDKNGICRYVRKDFEVAVQVLKPKPKRRRRR